MAVRLMSSMRSTPMIRAIPAAGMPTDPSTMDRMTMPTPGVEGAPMEAPTEVSTISAMPLMPISMPNTWARKIAAMPW